MLPLYFELENERERIVVNRNLFVLITVALLSGMAFILMFFEFPIPPFPAFLQYDTGDIPALLGSFVLGPRVGVLVEAVKCGLFALSGKDEASWVGTAANFVAGASLVAAAGYVYRRMKGPLNSLLTVIAGTAAMVAATSLANYYVFFPLWNIPAAARWETLMLTIPFNVVKGLISSALALLLYARLRGLRQLAELTDKR